MCFIYLCFTNADSNKTAVKAVEFEFESSLQEFWYV